MQHYDFIIIGSGIAGLYTALLAQEVGTVLILTKGSIDECNTKYAQGGIAAAVGRDDSPELHLKDTLAAGAGLSDPAAARILAEEASDRITDLIRFGVPFDTQDGEIALAREAAHSVSRVLHAGGDATGEHIETSLSRQARLSPRIRILEHCLVTQLVTDGGGVCGAVVLDTRARSREEFRCRYLVLASGGGGQLFKLTTNPSVATGDGVALAYRAGAEVADMEFFQFHPTALRLPGAPPFLISEAVRGEGGVLRNAQGRAFMKDYSVAGDLAPRDIVARGILNEMQQTGTDRVYLDVTHLPARVVSARFPSIYHFCREHGLDITTQPIPVAPAAHYMMGGVRTNVWGETNLPGLYAAGETACTGVHGANRLASNSLLEVLIFAKRLVARAREGADAAATGPEPYPRPYRLSTAVVAVPPQSPLSLAALQNLLWEKVGIVRSKEGLEEAKATLAGWQQVMPLPMDRPSYELANLLLVGRLMTEAALLREESRGAHFRTDFPQPSPEWQQRHIIFREGS